MSQIERFHLPPLEMREGLRWNQYLFDSLLGIAGALLVTFIIYLFHLYPRIPNISLLYILVVLALASTRGLYAAIVTSVIAFLSFDFFLVPPYYTFNIAMRQEFFMNLCAIRIEKRIWSSS